MKKSTKNLYLNMVLASYAVAASFAVPTAAVAGPYSDGAPEEQVPCIEMLEGWYGRDTSRFEEILHPKFAKQGFFTDPRTGEFVANTYTKESFIAISNRERPVMPKDQWDITTETLDQSGPIATVKVTSARLIDVCQLGKEDGRWRIINTIWTTR